jgi:hypothetical protein
VERSEGISDPPRSDGTADRFSKRANKSALFLDQGDFKNSRGQTRLRSSIKTSVVYLSAIIALSSSLSGLKRTAADKE